VKQEGIGSDLAGAAATAAFGGVFDFLGGEEIASVTLDRIILPGVARFMGQLAQDTDYAREERDLPTEIAGIDVAATRVLAAARGNDRPIEVDVMFLEGGTPKELTRWIVPKVAADTEGVRLTFDWISRTPKIERVTASPVSSPLRGSPIETIPPIFATGAEQKAGDRSGPATLGILNPATEQIRILARDNLTVESKISLFAVFDANENGRFDDDVFYPLDTNVVSYARLPQRPFAIVGVDEQGNVGGLDPFTLAETRNFLVDKNPNESQSEYEKKLREIRVAVRDAINQGRSDSFIVGKYLLKPDHLWVFEQGSGANLWKPDFVQRCNGIYLPGKSDNDYELMLQLKLENPYSLDEPGRLRFLADGPHEEATLRGDWYFKRPTGLDVTGSETEDDQAIIEWRYTMPAGFIFNGSSTFTVLRAANDNDLTLGYRSPLTPAEVIARIFTKAVTDVPARRKLLPDTTFFPERREHFVFGQLHLERPPAFGDDPIGDAGTGRQMLLLKWLMEGAYVTSTDDASASNDFSPGAVSLASVYANWSRAGVPLAEGFEWGAFQDFAALKSRPFQVLSVRLSKAGADGPVQLVRRFYDDAALEQQASRLKKLGKAAIRAALARLAGDPNLNTLVAGVSADTVINNPPRSFEQFILNQARSTDQAKAAFGAFADDRDDVSAPPDLGDFLRAKNADRAYLQTILTTPGSYERFVTTTFEFLRTVVQAPTRPTYGAYTNQLQQAGKFSELLQRGDNLNFIIRGRGLNQPGLLALNTDRRISRTPVPIGVEVYSPGGVGPINISLDHSEADPAPAPLVVKKKKSIARADTLQTTIDGAADEGETVADGLDTQEGAAVIESSDERTIITELSAITGSAIDPTQEDNTVVVDATAIDPAIPPPVVSTDPIVFLTIKPKGNENLFLLDDWPALGQRPRSPRYLLRTTDRLDVDVWTEPGLPPFTARVFSESDPFGQSVLLTDSGGSGVYNNSAGGANAIQFTNDANSQTDTLVYVKDEEVLTVKITGNGIDKELKVMVDLAELSLATLQHLDRSTNAKPRFDYVAQFLNPANNDSFNFFPAGFTQFADNVAAVVNGGDNLMRQFIQNFADPALPSVGEADILYIHAHGGASGAIGDHISNSATNGQRRVVLDPVRDLAAQGFWRSDAEWAILDACLTLNPIVTPELLTSNVDPGRIRWQTVLSNINGEPGRRLPHGLLGFERTKRALRAPHLEFLIQLQRGRSFVDSWRDAMEATAQPWAMLYYRSAETDTVREISQDPAPGDTIVYFESSGFFSDEVCEECDGESDRFRAFDEISQLRLEHLPGNWTQAEDVLRAQGYDPNELWPLGVAEESVIELTPDGPSDRRYVARTYHWQKPISDGESTNALVTVRISDDGGQTTVLDAERMLQKGGRQ
jgi:hypothetical protein